MVICKVSSNCGIILTLTSVFAYFVLFFANGKNPAHVCVCTFEHPFIKRVSGCVTTYENTRLDFSFLCFFQMRFVM